MILRVNLTAVIWMCRFAIREMRASGGGSIVNISAVPPAGHPGDGGPRRHQGCDQCPHQVDCRRLCPGQRPRQRRGSRARAPRKRDAALTSDRRAVLEGMHLTRLATATDIARGVLYLASREAEVVTGTVLALDGGSTAARAWTLGGPDPRWSERGRPSVSRTRMSSEAGKTAPTRRRRIGHADTVADDLRHRILAGSSPTAKPLPKQEDLVATYRVSKAALRDALRILETEGLLSVRRGNVGGAGAHRPQPGTAAYTLGLVLEARGVSFAEVQVALRELEPVCAVLCAGRPDRRRTVLPSLTATQRRLRQAIEIDDPEEALAATRDFHEALVTGCGNETLIIVVGTLEAIWTAQAHVSGRLASAAGPDRIPSGRLVLAEHDEITDCIKRGDVDATVSSCRTHLQHARLHSVSPPDGAPVDTRMVRDLLVSSPVEGNRR